MPVAEEDLVFLEVLLADDGFLSGVLLDEESISTDFRFCLGGVNGFEEELGDEELVSILTGMSGGN